MKRWSVHEELTGEEVTRLLTADSAAAIEFAEPGFCALPIPDPELPHDVDARVRADLQAAREAVRAEDEIVDRIAAALRRHRAAAPDPEDIVATMRANGLHDPGA